MCVTRTLQEILFHIAIFTETWLSDNDEIWLKASDLVQHRYKTLHQNRPKHQAGGLVYSM